VIYRQLRCGRLGTLSPKLVELMMDWLLCAVLSDECLRLDAILH
jgi:hypothetical protein